jgi:hypothetical protein
MVGTGKINPYFTFLVRKCEVAVENEVCYTKENPNDRN